MYYCWNKNAVYVPGFNLYNLYKLPSLLDGIPNK